MTLTREDLREELQAALAPLQQAVTGAPTGYDGASSGGLRPYPGARSMARSIATGRSEASSCDQRTSPQVKWKRFTATSTAYS